MKISDAIKALEAIMGDEGDIDLTTYGGSGAMGMSFRVVNLCRPAGRETNLRYWQAYDGPDSKGRRVVAIGGDNLTPDDRVSKPAAPRKR